MNRIPNLQQSQGSSFSLSSYGGVVHLPSWDAAVGAWLDLPCPDLGNASLTPGNSPAFSILLHICQSWAVSRSPVLPGSQLNKHIFHRVCGCRPCGALGGGRQGHKEDVN